MELKWKQGSGTYLYRVLCILTVVAALLPVACDYIMSGGIVTEWMARLEEIAVAPLRLFPSPEVFMELGIRENAMDSNLWFFLPGFLYRVSGSIVLTYRIFMLMIQIGTLLFSKLFFERFFQEGETKFSAFFGILLYMTCPYRIYICYDRADFSAAIAWMLLPLYAWAMSGLLRDKKSVWTNFSVAALSLAGLGYADAIYFLVLAAMTLFTVVYFRKLLPVAAVAAGSVLSMPVLFRLMQYLFTDAYQGLGLPVQSIMSQGYRIGQFFSTYAFRDEHPGMGLGLLGCLLAGLWLWFVDRKGNCPKNVRAFVILAVMLLILSTRYFPWDLVQRLGTWALKLVALIHTPAIFCGMAWGCLCIPASNSVGCMATHENKILSFYAPVIVLVASIGVCVYQCNMLTYNRFPIGLQ